MATEEDGLTLIEQPKRRRRAKNGRDWNDEAQPMETFSDSDAIQDTRLGPHFQETAVFSDALSDAESLPSYRAMAASLKKEVRIMDQKETTPLLMEGDGEEKRNGLAGSDDSEETTTTYSTLGQSNGAKKRPNWIKKWYNYIKVASLTFFVVVCVIMFAVNEQQEDEEKYHYFIRLNDGSYAVNFTKEDTNSWKFVRVDIKGPFLDLPFDSDNSEDSNCSDFIFVCGEEERVLPRLSCLQMENNSHCDSFKVTHTAAYTSSVTKTLELKEIPNGNVSQMVFVTQHSQALEFQITVHGEILAEYLQVILAAIILVGVYILIGFDVVHRTMAAMIGSTCTLAVLSMLHKRPSLHEVVQMIDLDTVSLLFGMMTLVGIFSQTGFFDYSAVKAYKLARGKIWPLITLLCFFSAIVSAFLVS